MEVYPMCRVATTILPPHALCASMPFIFFHFSLIYETRSSADRRQSAGEFLRNEWQRAEWCWTCAVKFGQQGCRCCQPVRMDSSSMTSTLLYASFEEIYCEHQHPLLLTSSDRRRLARIYERKLKTECCLDVVQLDTSVLKFQSVWVWLESLILLFTGWALCDQASVWKVLKDLAHLFILLWKKSAHMEMMLFIFA